MKKVIIVIWVIIMIAVISWFITDTNTEEEVPEPTATHAPVLSSFTQNGLRFDLPCPAVAIKSEDTQIDEDFSDISSFSAIEYAVSQMSTTYKVVVGYMNELPSESTDFLEASHYWEGVTNNLSIASEEDTSFGRHYVLESETVKTKGYDLIVNMSGCFLFATRPIECGSPQITGTTEDRTNQFAPEQETSYTKWADDIDWIQVFDTAFKEKKSIKDIILNDMEVDIANWERMSTITDTPDFQIEYRGVYVLEESDCYAVEFELKNKGIKETDGFPGARVGDYLWFGLAKDGEVTWLSNGSDGRIADIRYVAIPEGEKIKGYAVFERPDNYADYDSHVVRYYKRFSDTSGDIKNMKYIEGSEEILYDIPLELK